MGRNHVAVFIFYHSTAQSVSFLLYTYCCISRSRLSPPKIRDVKSKLSCQSIDILNMIFFDPVVILSIISLKRRKKSKMGFEGMTNSAFAAQRANSFLRCFKYVSVFISS